MLSGVDFLDVLDTERLQDFYDLVSTQQPSYILLQVKSPYTSDFQPVGRAHKFASCS